MPSGFWNAKSAISNSGGYLRGQQLSRVLTTYHRQLRHAQPAELDEDGIESVIWVRVPDGGLEPGETHRDAAVREVHEETGYAGLILGPLIGERRHVVTWHDGVTYDCAELWFLARVDTLEVDTSMWTDDERVDMGAHGWWTVEDLEIASVEFAPNDLAARVRCIVADGPPADPWHLGR